MALTKQAAEIWRAYATDGVPSSGAHKPLKSEVALWGTELESLMPAFVTPEFYGAVGDGTTDDRDALATALSSGSQVYLTRQYRIASNLTASSAALIFAGGSIIPDSGIAFGISGSGDLQVVPGSRIIDTSEGGVLRTNSTDLRGPALKISHYVPYDLTDDATEGLKLALKDLFTLNYYALDLEGRQVRVSSSLVMDVVTGLTTKVEWKRIHNGEIYLTDDFSTNSPTSTGTVTAAVTGGSDVATVASTAALAKGMEVSGTDIPRATYIKSIDSATQFTMTRKSISNGPSRTITWKKHAFLFDFLNFSRLSRFTFSNIYFNLREEGSGYRSSADEDIVEFKDCRFVSPETYGICQYNEGGGITIDGCDFLCNDAAIDPPDRTRIAVVMNGDCRVINNRTAYFRHAFVIDGGSTQFIGNHPFAGAGSGPTGHMANVIYMRSGNHVISANYIDNGWIEFSNEAFGYNSGAPAGGGIICGNRFTTKSDDAAEAFIVIKPMRSSTPIERMIIEGNGFQPLLSGGSIALNYPTAVDTSNGTIDAATSDQIIMRNNTFNNVAAQADPAKVKVNIGSGTTVTAGFANKLPFGLAPKFMTSVTVIGSATVGNVRSTGVSGNNVDVVCSTAASASTDFYVEATCNSGAGLTL